MMYSLQKEHVYCCQMGHQGQQIGYLCLNPNCFQQSPVCFICSMQAHDNCRDKMMALGRVPESLWEFQLLYGNIQELKNQIDNLFKKLLSKIEQQMSPIAQYQEKPNFTNLMLIGKMLRSMTKQTISQDTEQYLKIIRELLNTQNFSQSSRQFMPNQQKLQQNQSQKQLQPISIDMSNNVYINVYPNTPKQRSSTPNIKLQQYLSTPQQKSRLSRPQNDCWTLNKDSNLSIFKNSIPRNTTPTKQQQQSTKMPQKSPSPFRSNLKKY